MFEAIAAFALILGPILSAIGSFLSFVLKVIAILLLGALVLAIVLFLLPPVLGAARSLGVAAHSAFLASWVEPIPTLVNGLSAGQWGALALIIGAVPAMYAAWWIYRILRWFL